MSNLQLVKFYHLHYDDLGRMWFVPYDTKFPADDIWRWSPERNGRGLPVRSFTLSPGTAVETKGASISTAESLFLHTGVDVRERHAIKLTVKRRVGDQLIYVDHDWVVSSVEASRANAQLMSDHSGHAVVATIQTVDNELTFILNPEPAPTDEKSYA